MCIEVLGRIRIKLFRREKDLNVLFTALRCATLTFFPYKINKSAGPFLCYNFVFSVQVLREIPTRTTYATPWFLDSDTLPQH